MTEQEYLDTRVNDQINWYDKKSSWNQKRFKTLRILNSIFSVSIPLFTTLMNDDNKNFLKIIIGSAGALIAILEAIINVYKYQENWIQYRATAESLKHHKYLFETKTGIYADANTAFTTLTENIENLISKENTVWISNNQTTKNQQAGK